MGKNNKQIQTLNTTHERHPKSPTPSSPPQQHGHSHGNGQTCNHSHGGPSSSSNHLQNEEEDEYPHHPPTQIPYYIVLMLILTIWGGFLLTSFVFENRQNILSQGTQNKPFLLPEWLPGVSNPYLRPLYHLTPFSLHPAQWITFALISWCFFLSFIRVTYTDPGCVEQFDLVWGFHKQSSDIQQKLHYDAMQHHQTSILPQTLERKHNGARRYCRKTNVFKPDRAHYCHATNRLVKRLDHYCIFLSASVGYNNHKFFVLFLWWLVIMGSFIGIKMFIPMEFIWRLSGLHMIVNLIIACFGLATAMALFFFFLFHIYLIAKSLTTIESGEKYNIMDYFTGYFKTSPYDVDLYLNFTQVFGHGPIMTWFIPTHPQRLPDEDGTVYPVSVQVMPGITKFVR